VGVLIRRCAWHRSYHGYSIAFGIASWRGLRVSFTDGMCLRCTVRFRREWNLPELKKRRAAFVPAHGLARAAMVVVVAASFTLAAHQLDDARTRETLTAPPETVLVPAVPSEEELVPALAIAQHPRRARTDLSMVARAEARRRSARLAGPTIGSIAQPSDSTAPTSSAVVSITRPVVTIAYSAPAAIPPLTLASRVRQSAAIEVAFVSVPHAGLMHQAP
jgi:hypothetical protein